MNIDFEQFKKQFNFVPLGLKLNNIGCIRYNSTNKWIGQLENYRGFVKFYKFENGLRAFTFILMSYIYKYRLFDVFDIIERYSPYNDGNNPIDYAKYVIEKSGFSKIPMEIVKLRVVLPCVMFQMSCVENGNIYREQAFKFHGFVKYFSSLVSQYIDEYLNNVVYPVHGKTENI